MNIVKKLFLVLILVLLPLYFWGCDEATNPAKETNVGNPPEPETPSASFIATDDAGSSWEVFNIYYVDVMKSMTSLNLVSPEIFNVVCNGGKILRSIDGGGSWDSVFTPAGNINLNSIAYTGVANYGVIAGNNGTLFMTANNGENWSEISSPVTSNLNCVKFDTASGIGYAVGVNSTILQSFDRGYTWIIINSPVDNSAEFTGVDIINPVSPVVVVAGNNTVTSSPVIILSTNGGNDWITASIPAVNTTLKSMSFLDTLYGVVAGTNGVILRTGDGGYTWSQVTSGVTGNLNAVLYSTQYCFAAGDKVVLRSFDLAQTWNVTALPEANGSLYGIFQAYEQSFFLIGD